jgi:hypothetical protein
MSQYLYLSGDLDQLGLELEQSDEAEALAEGLISIQALLHLCLCMLLISLHLECGCCRVGGDGDKTDDEKKCDDKIDSNDTVKTGSVPRPSILSLAQSWNLTL